ncbi:MAG: histidine phosphatase family protein [Alphaproteobacteria bacterium]|nr:histidine phosphatase family protein [Alphaproteobacteria bacterium]
MTKTLYLLRHAKSAWSKPHLADAERPLTARGRKAGTRMGKAIARRGWVPELVLCSTTARTRETFKHLAKGLEKVMPGATPPVAFEDGLYLADADALLARSRAVGDPLASALILGHNTCLQDFALALPAGGGPLVDKIAAKFPTAALAVIRFDIESWRDLVPGGGCLTDVLYPRDLD